MSRVIDLDKLTPTALDDIGVEALEAITSAIERVKAHRAIDPELRATILRRVVQALADGRLSDTGAAAIRSELDEAVPIAVLTEHFAELTPPEILSGPALGAFPRRERPDAPGPDEWLRADPRRLANVVAEMHLFTTDLQRIVQAALDLADAVGIDEQTADRVICAAVRSLSKGTTRDQ